jgi:hypothetical protein
MDETQTSFFIVQIGLCEHHNISADHNTVWACVHLLRRPPFAAWTKRTGIRPLVRAGRRAAAKGVTAFRALPCAQERVESDLREGQTPVVYLYLESAQRRVAEWTLTATH